jgi:hypothetical protein
MQESRPRCTASSKLPGAVTIVFDPMNAHSQGDDPSLMYVMQFNADEREWQEPALSDVKEEPEE